MCIYHIYEISFLYQTLQRENLQVILLFKCWICCNKYTPDVSQFPLQAKELTNNKRYLHRRRFQFGCMWFFLSFPVVTGWNIRNLSAIFSRRSCCLQLVLVLRDHHFTMACFWFSLKHVSCPPGLLELVRGECRKWLCMWTELTAVISVGRRLRHILQKHNQTNGLQEMSKAGKG